MINKRKTGKTIFTVLLTAVLAFSLTVPVFAAKGYFYDQLNASEKEMFDALDSDEAVKNGTSMGPTDYGTATFSKRAVNAFLLDNRNLFWIEFGNNSSKTHTFSWEKNLDWASGAKKNTLASDISAMKNSVDKIVSEASTKSTLREKLLYVHDWIITNNAYNSEAASNPKYMEEISYVPWSPLSALVSGEKSPVCEGYAKAFKVVCDALGVRCIVVSGMGVDESHSEEHMWNMVQMDNGKWYGVDCTWDDPVPASGDKKKKESGFEKTGNNAQYFLVGSNTVCDGLKFGESHKPDSSASPTPMAFTNAPLEYPTIEKNAFPGGGSTSKIGLSTNTVTVQEGKTVTVTLPKNTSATVKSSNTSVATAKYTKSTGKIVITGKSAGKAKVSVTVGKVTEKIAVTVSATPFEISTDPITVKYNAKYVIKALKNKNITVKSSNKAVAEVKYDKSSGKITITGKKKGKATVTVKYGETYKIPVTVDATTTKLKLSKGTVTISKGKTTTVGITATPNKSITGETPVVTVTEGKDFIKAAYVKKTNKVKITAKAAGTAKVKVKVGKKSAKITVKVK